MTNSRHFSTLPLVSREMTCEERAQKFHTDGMSLPGSRQCFRLVEANFPRSTTMRSSVLRLHFAGKPVVALFSQAGDKHILTVLDVEK